MTTTSTGKEIMNTFKELGTLFSGPVGFIMESYNIYYTYSMIKNGKTFELGCEKTGNIVGKKVGNIVGGAVGTILCPGGGTVGGYKVGGMIGSFIGGKGFKYLGENINKK